ncbi:MAG TPA: VOC family protein [Kofleriaceae bacterium]|nr:VOC family protein [Kofleriaceae bacterium]
MKVLGIHSVRVVVKSRDEARAFLEPWLGLERAPGEGGYRCDGPGPAVEIVEDPDLVVDPDRGGYLYRHIGFEVDSLAATLERCLGHRWRLFLIAPSGDERDVVSPDDDLSFSAERVVFVRDQDHNLWELVQRGLSLASLFCT